MADVCCRHGITDLEIAFDNSFHLHKILRSMRRSRRCQTVIVIPALQEEGNSRAASTEPGSGTTGGTIGAGNSLDNFLYNGTSGNVTLSGGAGNDIYYAGTSDTIVENANEGADWVYLYKGTDGSYSLPANVENLLVYNSLPSLAVMSGNSSDNIIDATSLGHGATI